MSDLHAVPRRLVLAVCVLAAAVRIAAFVGTDRLRHPEVWESETVATNLVEGRGFTYVELGTVYRSYMEPLYPALCAVVYRLTNHSFWVLGLVQVLLGVTLVWFVFECGRRVVPERAAVLAALLAAFHPGLVLYTTKFHPFVLDSALWFATFAAVLAFSAERPWRSVMFAGSLIGLCVLTRPTILACVPIIFWWIWVRSTDVPRVRAVQCLTLALCAGLVVSPWVWRNYKTHKRFMLTRSGTSFVFWLGNNPYIFTGSSMTPDGVPVIDAVPETVRRQLGQLDELGQQDYFRDQTLQFIRSHPTEFIRRWVLKVGYFWWFSPQAGLSYPAAWLRIFQVFYTMILAVASLGLWSCWRDGALNAARQSAVWLVVGCCLSISVLQGLYYVEGRHRLAIEPFLLIFAGAGLTRLMGDSDPA